MYNTIEEYALAMSVLLFEMRIESEYCNEEVSEEYFNKIVDDPEHMVLIKKRIYDNVLEGVQQCPNEHMFDGELGYNANTYDYAQAVDNYVEELYEAERQARLIVKYKVWVEIERIETDPEDGEESYSDCEFPESIAYRETFEDATQLQQDIVKTFGEI